MQWGKLQGIQEPDRSKTQQELLFGKLGICMQKNYAILYMQSKDYIT